MIYIRFKINNCTADTHFIVSDVFKDIIKDGEWTAHNDKKPHQTPHYTIQRHATKSEKAAGWPDKIQLHRFLLGLKKGSKGIVDHIKGNWLDNQLESLRITDNQHNCMNKKPHKRRIARNKTLKKGVCTKKGVKGKPYYAQIMVDGVQKSLGYFKSAEEAEAKYVEAAQKYFGEYARFK